MFAFAGAVSQQALLVLLKNRFLWWVNMADRSGVSPFMKKI